MSNKVTLYIPQDELSKLKSKLALENISLSAWFRQLALAKIEQKFSQKTIEQSPERKERREVLQELTSEVLPEDQA